MRRAYTLVEIVVSLGILALLVGLLLPVFTGAKERGGAVTSLANLRSIGQVVEMHQSVHHGEYPFYVPNEPVHIDPEYGGLAGFTPHWVFRSRWPISQKIYDLAPWEEHYLTWLSPGASVGAVRPWFVQDGESLEFREPSYHYSNSFIGDPRVWTDDPPPWEEMAKKSRAADVLFPSAKVVFWDNERAYLRPFPTADDPTPVLFADGSAHLRLDTEATPSENNPYFVLERVYNDTPEGVRGRDF